MSYSKTFKPERYAPIQHLIDEIYALEPGEKITYSTTSKKTLKRVRSLAYEWLFHQDLKKNYRLKVDYDCLELTFKRVGAVSLEMERADKPRQADELIEALILLSEEVAEELMEKWKSERRITSGERLYLQKELKRLLS